MGALRLLHRDTAIDDEARFLVGINFQVLQIFESGYVRECGVHSYLVMFCDRLVSHHNGPTRRPAG